MSLASSASQLLLVTCLASPVVAFHTDCHCFFLSLLLQSPLASLIPQAPAAHSLKSRLSPLQDFCPSLLLEANSTPLISRNLLHGDPSQHLASVHLDSPPRRAAMCPRGGERAAWLGGLPSHCRQGSSCSLLRFPWEKGLPYRLPFVEHVGCTRHCAQKCSDTV